jgi:hypothetical protein
MHALAAFMTFYYAGPLLSSPSAQSVALVIAGLGMAALVFLHNRFGQKYLLKTSALFLFESLVLAFIAWNLYKQGQTRSTFIYEGISVLFLSLAAFSFLLRKKREVIFQDMEGV